MGGTVFTSNKRRSYTEIRESTEAPRDTHLNWFSDVHLGRLREICFFAEKAVRWDAM